MGGGEEGEEKEAGRFRYPSRWHESGDGEVDEGELALGEHKYFALGMGELQGAFL